MLVKLQVAQNLALSWKSLGIAVDSAQLITSQNQVLSEKLCHAIVMQIAMNRGKL